MKTTEIDTSAIRRRLLRWYHQHARDLPWRQTSDPYAIWISEIMLQQTQVDTVIPYYLRFLKSFPTVSKLAHAHLDTVLKHWEGLGYYSRARNMHRAAQVIHKDLNGAFPDTHAGLLKLPGIGRYTAGAIASIAFGRPEPLVDGNVARVFCRLFAIDKDPKSTAVQQRLWDMAGELVQGKQPGNLNQALMELGALICRPKQPDCQGCPLQGQCLALAQGKQDHLPIAGPKKKIPLRTVALGIIWRNGKILIDQRHPQGHLGGLWEFPGGKRQGREALTETLKREVREEIGIEITVRERMMVVNHAYSHFRVRLYVFECDYLSGKPQAKDCVQIKWVPPKQLKRYAFPGANQVMIDRILTLSKQE